MINDPSKNKPLYNSTYSFIAQVNGKKMEFVSEKEYEEYIEKPIEIIQKYEVEYKQLYFSMKIVFYKSKVSNMYFAYKASQYFNHKPDIQVYTFEDYWDAFRKYKELGGK
jgi:predicted Zn-dependent peptidase